ncbi:hypothetical protein DIPPA_21069 [Diplonema papillatum]|nr:hypothetical protein DIPPA_21069 [Diplonema papillatum]
MFRRVRVAGRWLMLTVVAMCVDAGVPKNKGVSSDSLCWDDSTNATVDEDECPSGCCVNHECVGTGSCTVVKTVAVGVVGGLALVCLLILTHRWWGRRAGGGKGDVQYVYRKMPAAAAGLGDRTMLPIMAQASQTSLAGKASQLTTASSFAAAADGENLAPPGLWAAGDQPLGSGPAVSPACDHLVLSQSMYSRQASSLGV